MDIVDRRDFSQGWQPSLDAQNGDPRALLLLQNLVQEEEGVLATRFGFTLSGTLPITTFSVHTIYTTILNDQRYRFVGSGDDLWVTFPGLGGNFTRRQQGMAGSGDMAMGTFLDQFFYARGTTKRKYDGLETGGDNGVGCRNWGIAAPTVAPTVNSVEADQKTIGNFDGSDFGMDDGDYNLTADRFDHDGRAFEVIPTEKGMATLSVDYGSEQDFTRYGAGQLGIDEDNLSLYVAMQFPDQIEFITIMLDCNGDSAKLFADDFYYYDFTPDLDPSNEIDPAQMLKPGMVDRDDIIDYDIESYKKRRQSTREFIKIRPGTGPFENNAQWQQIRVKRGAMKRFGSSTGKDWSTIRAARIVIKLREDLPANVEIGTIKFDEWIIKGGAERALSGEYVVRYQYVFNSGIYKARSPLSPKSESIQVENCGLQALIPAPSDPQVNEIDVFVLGGFMDRYYRFNTTHQTSGNIRVDLFLSDRDAIEQNDFAEVNIVGPPDNIIDIIAPHYGRLIAVTSRGIFPSLVANPDAFNPNHAIQTFDKTERIWWARKMGTGIAICTSKDIYALEGTGVENVDGTIGFRLRALNTGAGATCRDHAQEGDTLFYMASDGWRVFDGGISRSLHTPLDILYRGYGRYGVGAANLGSAPGRFRPCIFSGFFYTMFSSGGATNEVHRYDIKNNRWSRFIYPVLINHLYREPDGKIMAGGSAGQVYQLENGTTDNGSSITWEILTCYDGGVDPRINKEMFDYRVFAEGHPDFFSPGVYNLSVDLFIDGTTAAQATLNTFFTGIQDLMWQSPMTVADIPASFRRVQSRIYGSGPIKITGYGFAYRPRPIPLRFWDSGLVETGYIDLTWIGEVDVKLRTTDAVEIQVWFDEVKYGTYTVPSTAGVARPYSVPIPRNFHGYQPRIVVRSRDDVAGQATVTSATFELYWVRFKTRRTGKATAKSVITVAPIGTSGYTKVGDA